MNGDTTMEETPLVSVVLNTYNRQELLPEAAESVLSQDYSNLELIIVDDFSTDNTAGVMASIAEEAGERVRCIRLESNSGLAAGRNVGIRAARGPLIALLDDDDLWLPGKLTAQVEALRAHPECALCYVKAMEASPEGEPTGREFGHSVGGHTGDNFDLMLRYFHIVGPGIVVRASVLDEVGLFDETLMTAEDTELFLRLTIDHPAVFVDRPLVLIREHVGRKTAGEAVSGEQARCWLEVFSRFWDLPESREASRGVLAARLAMAQIAVAAHEAGGILDEQALRSLIEAHPEWFEHAEALWHVADSTLAQEIRNPGSVASMADWLSEHFDNGAMGRRHAANFLSNAVRRGIRRGMPMAAAGWAMRYALMTPRLAWDRIAGRE